jgi:hypothetical protein
MRNIIKSIVLVLILLVLTPLGNLIAQEKELGSTDESLKVISAFNTMQSAIKAGDYDWAWQLNSKARRQKRFNGDFEFFKKSYKDNPAVIEKFCALRVEEVIFLTATQAQIVAFGDTKIKTSEISSEEKGKPQLSPPSWFFMVKEDGEWKFSGIAIKHPGPKKQPDKKP